MLKNDRQELTPQSYTLLFWSLVIQFRDKDQLQFTYHDVPGYTPGDSVDSNIDDFVG